MIELIIFIIIVSIGVTGLLVVFSNAVQHSADPVLRKQSIAIAETLLAEIEQQNFTYCDPQDANVTSATGTGGCASTAEDAGQAAGTTVNGPFPNTESRGSATDPLDNVADYGGFDQTGIGDVSGGNVMAGYRARVTITRVGSAAPFASIPAPAGAVLQIDVRVSKAGTDDVVLTGYRFRYAPNSAG